MSPAIQSHRRGLSSRALDRVCSYIAENLCERVTLGDLAREACVSRFHFARSFRISTGYSPMEYRLKSRIERAMQMLLQDERPVCEIAALLGFCDQSHLTRTFRRLTGLTPTEFTRRHLYQNRADRGGSPAPCPPFNPKLFSVERVTHREGNQHLYLAIDDRPRSPSEATSS
jgi:AraC family transcriptional regulator